MKISGVVEKYVRLVTDMYDSVLRCAFGVKDWFKMVVGIASGIGSEPPLIYDIDAEVDIWG